MLGWALKSATGDDSAPASRAPRVFLADVPTPGSTIVGPWAIVSEAFKQLLADGPTNTRSLDDSTLLGCVPGYGICSGEDAKGPPPRSGSKTETRHGCGTSADGCEGPQRTVVVVAGNPGVISTQISFTVAYDGSKVSLDLSVETYAEIHDAATGATIFRIESTGTGHADGDACPDASGTTKLHIQFTAKENYFNDADKSAASVGYGLNQSYAADVTVRTNDNANMTGIDIAASAHEDSKGGVKTPGSSQSDLFAHSVDASDTQTFGYDPKAGFTDGTPRNQTATSMDALSLSVWMDMFTSAAAKAAAQAAEKAWRSGMCILVHATPNGGSVGKDSVTDINVTVKQRYNGSDLDKPVEATFSGVTLLDPLGQKQPAPASYVYTAGSTEGDRGFMTFTSVSNRGIGHTSLNFVVAAARTLSGTLSFRYRDVTRPEFMLTEEGTLDVRLRLDSKTASTMTFVDDGSKLTYSGRSRAVWPDALGDPVCTITTSESAGGTFPANQGEIRATYTTGDDGSAEQVALSFHFLASSTEALAGCDGLDAEPQTGGASSLGCAGGDVIGVPTGSTAQGRAFDFGCKATFDVWLVWELENSGTLVLSP